MTDSTDYLKWMSRAEQDIRMARFGYEEDPLGLADSICYSIKIKSQRPMI